MKHLIIIILLYPFAFKAQNKRDLSVDFNLNVSNHNMKLANQFMNEDQTYTWFPISVKNSAFKTLNHGLDYNLGVNYQPLNFMDFGVFANYQNSSIKRTYIFDYFPDPLNYPDSSYKRNGKIRNETSAFTFGISTNLYINKLLHLKTANSNFLSKFIVSIGLKGGIGISSFSEKWADDDFHSDSRNFQYNATNLNGRAELNVGYPICNKSFFSHIGLKIGYQYFKTSPIKNFADLYLYPANSPNTKVSLDFSGIYYGIYLRIGK